MPIITNSAGKVEKPATDFMFVYGQGTEVYESCSINWQGEMYIFGGAYRTTQISKLSGCKVERVNSLQFDHRRAACANMNDQSIYLCFNDKDLSDAKKCRKGDNPYGSFVEISQSNSEHIHSRLGVSQGKVNF